MLNLLLKIGTISDATKKDFLALHFLKKPYLGFFLKFSTRGVLFVLGHIFNKVNSGAVQTSDAVGP